VHVSRARQILVGEIPVRDFFDPGLPLQYYASAWALHLTGVTLLGEAVLTIFFVSLGAALAYSLGARLARSRAIGAAAALMAIATFPRLYGYPKVFLFVLAIACAWRYAERRTTLNLCLMALLTAVAFLFRHDHGVYIGIALTVFLLLLGPAPGQLTGDERRGWRLPVAAGTYVGVTALLLLPFFVFIQSVVGIPRYVGGVGPQAQSISTFRLNMLPLRIDWSAPLVDVNPRSEPRIYVRWRADATDDTRHDRERRYGLSRPVADQDRTWSYVVTNEDPHNIAALLTDPLVADTHGVDREQARVAVVETPYRRLQRWIPLLRMRVAPGILTSENAVVWLYYVTLALPFVGTILLLSRRRTRQRREALTNHHGTRVPASDSEFALVGALIVLCFVIGQALVRESPESRLPDIATPMAVLGAWVAGRWIHRSSGRARLRAVVAMVFWLVTFWGAATLGSFGERLFASGLLGGPTAARERLARVNGYLTTRPIDGWTDTGSTGLRALAEWAIVCTAPSDRLLVTWFAPELFFYAERPFAGGQVYLHPGWHSSIADQQLTIARMMQQRVPVVLTSTESEPAIRKAFPLVLDYVDRQYTVAARATFGSLHEYGVFVNRDIPPTGTYEPLDLPCYR
jgi:hypothetical protein